ARQLWRAGEELVQLLRTLKVPILFRSHVAWRRKLSQVPPQCICSHRIRIDKDSRGMRQDEELGADKARICDEEDGMVRPELRDTFVQRIFEYESDWRKGSGLIHDEDWNGRKLVRGFGWGFASWKSPQQGQQSIHIPNSQPRPTAR
ncbi:hypothetical protein LTR40_011224, partial [Exophiala xenobiotica]